eukprot:gene3291-9346_t
MAADLHLGMKAKNLIGKALWQASTAKSAKARPGAPQDLSQLSQEQG